MNIKKAITFYFPTIVVVLFFIVEFSAQKSYFLENKGQVFDQNGKFNREVNYVLSLKDYNVSFYKDHFCYELFSINNKDSAKLNVERIEVWFDEANPKVSITPLRKNKEVINVFKNGASFTGIRSYESIYYNNILEGVDIEFFIHDNKLKYNYIVSNLNINSINLKVKGGKASKKNGVIYLKTANNEIKETIPESYYLFEKNQKKAKSIEINVANHRVQYLLPQNRTETFVIDPIAYGNEYTSYYGGAHMDFAQSINVSKSNQVIVSGFTVSTNNIATIGAFQTTISDQDAFIASFDQNGNRNWATYFGGDSQERSYSAALDSNDNIFISGGSTSQIGLSTTGVFQQFIASGDDAFIAKFSSLGILIWSTYYGGDGHELITNLIIDDSNKVYVTGHTASTNLQCTPNAFRNGLDGTENAFLGVFNNDGSVIYNSYYIKGSSTRGEGIAIGNDGSIYVAGFTNDSENINDTSIHQANNGGFLDGFLIKLNAQFQMVWKTYLGGEENDLIQGLSLDSLQNIYLVGKTRSTLGIATINGLQNAYTNNWDGFIVKLDSSCSQIWGSYLNAGNNDELNSVVAKDTSVWVLGVTNGNALLIDSSAFQTQNNGGFDSFFMKLTDSGSFVWSSYLGGAGDEFANDLKISSNNKILIAGQTNSNTNLATLNAHQVNYGGNLFDGFWTKFCKPTFPTLLSKSGSFSICEGDTLTVNSLNSFSSYTWSNGDTTNSLAITQAGNYVLKTKDLNHCPGRSDTLKVDLIPKVTLTIEKSSEVICNNDSVLLSVNGAYSSYLWGNGETTPSIYVTDQQAYSLMVTNNFGCHYFSDNITLTIAQYMYPISIIGDTVICSGGESILFTNDVFSNIVWNSLSTNNSITVFSSGDYSFEATDTNGCSVVSDTISITQINNPPPSLVLDTSTFFNVCFGDTVNLKAEENFMAYEWSNGVTNKFIEITTSGYFFVEATDSNGCVGISDSIQVIVNPLPIVKIEVLSDTICLNDSVLVASTLGLQNYNWSNGETNSSFYLPIDSLGTYQILLEGTDLNNCKNSDSTIFLVIDCAVFSNINNPNENSVNIYTFLNQLEIKANSFIEDISIYDHLGKLVYSQKNINNKEVFIDINSLISSTYILKVNYVNRKEPLVKKFIVLKR